MKDQHLISVDELRAAGALDVPASWRKSLGAEQPRERDLFSDLVDDDDASLDEEDPVPVDAEDTGTDA